MTATSSSEPPGRGRRGRPLHHQRGVRRLAAVALAIGLGGCLGVQTGEEPQFDVCRKQIETYVRENLGQQVTDIIFYYVYERRDLLRWDYSKAVVSVSECPGYHYFEVHAIADTCEMLPHYGRQPDYLYYLGAFDGC